MMLAKCCVPSADAGNRIVDGGSCFLSFDIPLTGNTDHADSVTAELGDHGVTAAYKMVPSNASRLGHKSSNRSSETIPTSPFKPLSRNYRAEMAGLSSLLLRFRFNVPCTGLSYAIVFSFFRTVVFRETEMLRESPSRRSQCGPLQRSRLDRSRGRETRS